MFSFSSQRVAHTALAGFSIVEVIIGSALLLLMFGGIIAGFQSSLVMVGHARANTGAVALASERLEYVRSMPFDAVGTVGGIPNGSIPQNETVMLNNVTYNRRTLIQFVDAPEDGLGVSDTNGITADYKRVKVEMTWTIRGSSRKVALVSNVVPKGIETLAGGGTLVVNVFDALAAPVEDAEVRIVNNTTTSTIDVTTYSNAAGMVMFPGAPAAGGYQISATKSGYSLDQTYTASGTNPNPNPPPVSVVAGGVSTVGLAIDRLSTRILQTVNPPLTYNEQDTFADASKLISSSSVLVAGDELVLTGTPGAYAISGSASTTSIAPADLLSWDSVQWDYSLAIQTGTRVFVYSVDSGGIYTVIPDADLPGNGVGFTTKTISLASLSVATYPRIALGFELFSNGANTPRVLEWAVSALVLGAPIPSKNITLTGAKNIGTDGGGAPVKKYSASHLTNASGVVPVSLEWDQYTVSINGAAEGYDISDICTPESLRVAPNTTATTTVVLSPHTADSLLVGVFTAAGVPITGATVDVVGSGSPGTKTTSSCGYAFFTTNSSSYTVTTSASGYTTDVSTVAVSGATRVSITLAP